VHALIFERLCIEGVRLRGEANEAIGVEKRTRAASTAGAHSPLPQHLDNDVRSRSRGLLGDVFIFVCIEAYQTLSPLIRARRSRGGGAAAHRNALLLDVHRIRDRVVDCAVQVEAEK
jgi:hypothetical protein